MTDSTAATEFRKSHSFGKDSINDVCSTSACVVIATVQPFCLSAQCQECGTQWCHTLRAPSLQNYKLTNKDTVSAEISQQSVLLKLHYQGVRTITCTHTNTSLYMHTLNTNLHIQCEVIHDNTRIRDVHFMFSQVQMPKVYTNSYDDCV